jgi:hypothetical protein
MEINYSYKLVGLKKVKSFNELNDVIISVDFIISGEIPGLPKYDWALGDVPVDLPDVANFKPLDELTEEEILSWVVNDQQIPQVKDSLRRIINKQFTDGEYVAWNNEPTIFETQALIDTQDLIITN